MPIRAFALLIAVAVLVTACGDNSQKDAVVPPSPSVLASPSAATATSVARSCPVDADVCGFAREIERLLVAGQYEAIADRTHLYDYTCPGGTPSGAGGPFPLCFGAAPGEHRSGYSAAALQSEGTVESREGLIDVLRRWVHDGRGTTPVSGTRPVLATVGCPFVNGEAACDGRFAIVFTRGDGVSLLRLGVQRDGKGGVAQMSQTTIGSIAVNQKMVSGGDDDLPAVFGVEEGVGTRYFVLD